MTRTIANDLRAQATALTIRAMELDAAATTTAPDLFCTVLRNADGGVTAAAHEAIPGGYNMMGLTVGTVARLSRADAETFAKQYNAHKRHYTASVATLKETYQGLAQNARTVASALRSTLAEHA